MNKKVEVSILSTLARMHSFGQWESSLALCKFLAQNRIRICPEHLFLAALSVEERSYHSAAKRGLQQEPLTVGGGKRKMPKCSTAPHPLNPCPAPPASPTNLPQWSERSRAVQELLSALQTTYASDRRDQPSLVNISQWPLTATSYVVANMDYCAKRHHWNDALRLVRNCNAHDVTSTFCKALVMPEDTNLYAAYANVSMSEASPQDNQSPLHASASLLAVVSALSALAAVFEKHIQWVLQGRMSAAVVLDAIDHLGVFVATLLSECGSELPAEHRQSLEELSATMQTLKASAGEKLIVARSPYSTTKSPLSRGGATTATTSDLTHAILSAKTWQDAMQMLPVMSNTSPASVDDTCVNRPQETAVSPSHKFPVTNPYGSLPFTAALLARLHRDLPLQHDAIHSVCAAAWRDLGDISIPTHKSGNEHIDDPAEGEQGRCSTHPPRAVLQAVVSASNVIPSEGVLSSSGESFLRRHKAAYHDLQTPLELLLSSRGGSSLAPLSRDDRQTFDTTSKRRGSSNAHGSNGGVEDAVVLQESDLEFDRSNSRKGDEQRQQRPSRRFPSHGF